MSLTLRPGETVALLGPNGAGKSTTLDLLLGLERPDSGTVTLLGTSPREAIVAGRVGAMLQSGGLMGEVTVAELVRLACGLHPRPYPVPEVLARAGLTAIAGRRADKLSGGQAQRVRFALATAGDSDLIVLDEPTTGMDVTARRAFWATMRDQADQGRTVLFATHHLEEADAIADRVLVLHRGRLLADGTATEIKASTGMRRVSFELPGGTHDSTSDGTSVALGVAALRRLPAVTAVTVSPGGDRADAVLGRRRHCPRPVRAGRLPPQSRGRRARARTGLRRPHRDGGPDRKRGGRTRMNGLIRLEILRVLRNRKFQFFGVLYPSVLFLLIAGTADSTEPLDGTGGLTLPAYLMVSMASFGALTAVLMCNSERIAKERENGWVRQLRLTPLPGRGYVLAKTAAAAVGALPAIVLVFVVAAVVKDVRLDAWQWLALTAAIWAGSLVFAALGVAIGYAATGDAVRPITMIVYFGLSLLGGLWMPSTTFPGWLQDVAAWLPTHAYAALGRAIEQHRAPGVQDVTVLLAFFVLFTGGAAWLYRKDTLKA